MNSCATVLLIRFGPSVGRRRFRAWVLCRDSLLIRWQDHARVAIADRGLGRVRGVGARGPAAGTMAITSPLFLVVAGAAVEYTTHGSLADTLNSEIAERIAEIILAVLLFVDATAVRGGLFGGQPRSTMRLLFIALPLSLGLSVLLGSGCYPALSWGTLIVVACIVVLIDFSPAPSIVRDGRIPGPRPRSAQRRGRLQRRHHLADLHLRVGARRRRARACRHPAGRPWRGGPTLTQGTGPRASGRRGPGPGRQRGRAARLDDRTVETHHRGLRALPWRTR